MHNYRALDRLPRVEVYRLDLGDVHAQVPVDSGAPDAQEQTQIPHSSRVLVAVEILMEMGLTTLLLENVVLEINVVMEKHM